jgi:hypothetical protein
MAIARVFPAVTRDLEGSPDAPRCHYDRLGGPENEMALLAIVSECSGNAPRVEKKTQHSTFHVNVHSLMDAVVLKRPYHLQASAISDVRKTRVSMPTEVALQNSTVLSAIEQCAPSFQFANTIRSFLGMQLGHPPIVEVLSSSHRVGEMNSPVVAIIDVGECGCHAPFRHYGMRFTEE